MVAHLPDADEPTVIQPKGQRGRWERVVEAMPPAVERIELVDAKGAVLAAIDVDKPPAEGTQASRDLQLLALLNSAQDRQAERTESLMTSILGEYRQLAQVLATRLNSMEAMFQQVLQASFDATTLGAEAMAKLAAKPGDEDPALAMLMGVLEKKGLLGGAAKKVLTAAKDAPKNGTTAGQSGGKEGA